MKAKTYTQPNYDSVEEMEKLLEKYGADGVIKLMFKHLPKYRVEKDKKTALRKCCEERIAKGL